MLIFFFILCAFLGNLPAAEGRPNIELFCDFLSSVKGEDIYPIVEGEDAPLSSFLRKKLNESGKDLKNWEASKYRPWLLYFSEIKTFSDLKNWLKVGLVRKTPFLPSTSYWMFWNLGPTLKKLNFSKLDQNKLILVMWEPPTVQKELYDPKVQKLFGKIFTWDETLVDNKKFFKIQYPALKQKIKNIPPFSEKKFCTMVARRLTSKHPQELYSERKKMIAFFETKPLGEFDLYGHGWKKKKIKNFQGPIENKLDVIKDYKFSICYENTKNTRGYITEKIFDCFAAGTVPIYLGAENITDYIPENAFIDRRKFQSDEALYCFLKEISEETYQSYLDAAEKFLQSEKAFLFSKECFTQTVLPHLLRDL